MEGKGKGWEGKMNIGNYGRDREGRVSVCIILCIIMHCNINFKKWCLLVLEFGDGNQIKIWGGG